MVRIGCGAGFGGDRLEPAVRVLEDGNLDYPVLECLAERTIGLGQKRRMHDPSAGYDPLLERRMLPLLPLLKKKRARLIMNMGSANPIAAGQKIVRLAEELGLEIGVAVVTGDDVLDVLDPDAASMEDGKPISSHGRVLSANAYLGSDAIVPALASRADVGITGRVADPSLVVAPLVHHFGWGLRGADRIGEGPFIGPLLECAGQITGGYFAGPGRKDVPGLADLGFPFADVDESGHCKTPLKELTRSRKFQQPALANLWKSIGKSFLRKRMAGHMALMPRAVTRYRRDVPVLAVKRGPRNLAIRREVW